ncbi:MAG TPA: hypothetical protein VFX42_07310 [Gemmatimonadales bacterium]|nr:hypothetical protein [Gemmatimonadales bacterium]
MRTPPPIQALAAGTLILAAACSDRTEPTAPDNPPATVSLQPRSQGTPDDPIALARQVPGFGGFYLDDQGTPVVYLKSVAERGNAQRALAPFFQSQALSASQLRVLPARYEWAQLESWSSQATTEVLGVPGTVFVDADEASNRVAIGVEHGARARIQGIVARLGIPKEAVVLQETGQVRFAATLRSKVRPVVGGLQINFPGFLCSLGFNAMRNGQRSFITASHCTNHQGGVENTPYYQPLQTSTSPKIATEVSDPAYFRGNGCPPGLRCRFSDAARATYTPGTTSSLGKIAKTTGPNNGSITLNGSFNIISEGSAAVGQVVGKVGRTSGWSTGKVIQKCANYAVEDVGQFCQNVVSARVDFGDSGSPVFKGSSNVTLVGLLWGVILNQNNVPIRFIYSPMSGIEHDLGALTTF